MIWIWQADIFQMYSLFFIRIKEVQGGIYIASNLHVIWDYDLGLLMVFSEVKMLIAQLYPTLCDPKDCSLLASSVHGILQARILEWVAIPLSRESSQPRD